MNKKWNPILKPELCIKPVAYTHWNLQNQWKHVNYENKQTPLTLIQVM